MDSTTFDRMARNLSIGVSRRVALRSLMAGALAVTLGGVAHETEAKRRRKTKQAKKTRKQRALRPGQVCQTTQQCRHLDGNYICGQARIFAEERVCCGGLDALCDETGASGRSCCYGYLCASGRCIVV